MPRALETAFHLEGRHRMAAAEAHDPLGRRRTIRCGEATIVAHP
jgi:hypothetical protein